MSSWSGIKNPFGLGGTSSFQWTDYSSGRQPYPSRLYDLITEYHRAGGAGWDQVIDFGAGDCTIEPELLKRYRFVEATDESETQLQLGYSRLRSAGLEEGRLTIRQCLAGQHPGANESADLITAATCSHFFDVPAFIKDAARLLRPGGTLAIWSGGYFPVVVAGVEDAKLGKVRELMCKFSDMVIREWVEMNPGSERWFALRNIPVDGLGDEVRRHFRPPSFILSSEKFGKPEDDAQHETIIIEQPREYRKALSWRDNYTIKDLDALIKSVGRVEGKKPWIEEQSYLELRTTLRDLIGGEESSVVVVFPLSLLLARKAQKGGN